MTSPFERCPVCGGELVQKAVEKLLREDNHATVLEAEAEACLRCDERLYSAGIVRHFEEVRAKLKRQ